MKPENKRILGVIALVAAVVVPMHSLVVVTTPSIDKKVLFSSWWGSPELNDYVTYDLNHPLLKGKKAITKKIACVGGQTLTTSNREIFCDGLSLGVAKKTALNGEPLSIINISNEIIPNGMVYLAGTHVDSFDSRYFGLVDVNKTKKLIPIF